MELDAVKTKKKKINIAINKHSQQPNSLITVSSTEKFKLSDCIHVTDAEAVVGKVEPVLQQRA